MSYLIRPRLDFGQRNQHAFCLSHHSRRESHRVDPSDTESSWSRDNGDFSLACQGKYAI